MSSNEEYIKKNKVITVDDDKNTKLHYACALGNIEEVDKELATGQKIDPENYLGWTPLMMAVRNAHMLIVTVLLEHKADATKKNKFGMNIFLISVTCGDLDIVEKILNHFLCGGISRQSLQKIFSPISLSIMFGHPHIFKYLIDRSFDVNASTPFTDISPLMFAAAMSNYKAYRQLLQHKADVKQKNYLGRTAPEILQSRNQKFHITDSKRKSTHVPLIVISPNNTPQFQLTPYVTNNNNGQNFRKSSNIVTPNVFGTPNLTPITPAQFGPQIFFPPDFSPSQFISPVGYQSYQSNEFLNSIINQSTFISPTTAPVCSPSYV